MHRTFLYSKEFPKGKIFDDYKEYVEALKNGAVEAPWLINEPKEEKPAPFRPVNEPKEENPAPFRPVFEQNKKRKPGRPPRKAK